MEKLVIATRRSKLALWQSEFIKSELQKHYPHMQIELQEFVTKGDKILDVPLAKIGGKGLFTKELEIAMLEGEAHLAVHSLKMFLQNLKMVYNLLLLLKDMTQEMLYLVINTHQSVNYQKVQLLELLV